MKGSRVEILTRTAVVYPLGAWSLFLPVAAVGYLSVPVVGAAILRARAGHPVGWILLASGVSLPLASTAYLVAAAAARHAAPVSVEWAGWWDSWPWLFALGLAPTLGLLLFPNGRLPSPRWRPMRWLCLAQAVALLLGLLFSPGLLDYPDRANPTGLAGGLGSVAEGLTWSIVLIAPLSAACAWSLGRRRGLAADEVAALRLVRPAAWLLSAAWWAALVITAVTGESVGALPAEMLGMMALAVTAWIAIRRYRLFDGRQVLNRGLVYGLLTALVGAVYLAAAGLVRLLLPAQLGTAVAVVVAVLAALPLQDALQRAANRVVYGYRDDPYGMLVQLGRRLEALAAPDDVLPAVAGTVQVALRLAAVSVQVNGVTLARAGARAGGVVEEFPLLFAGETIGALGVETRDDVVTTAERRLLTVLAGQVATVAHAVTLRADLLRSRERLIGAAEEERRRLRRDLHDGLGPALAGVVLGLQRARRRLPGDTTAAAEQLDALTGQTQDAVAEVRRLVYGLRPPALDELGLVGALTEQGRSLGGIEVQGPGQEPELPAAVEVAAYRIALEAMTNAVRHAQAAVITVRVRVDDALRLDVADDGRGLPAGYQAGVGISSMRERAAELGGVCVIEARTPRGTLVRATLPLAVS